MPDPLAIAFGVLSLALGAGLGFIVRDLWRDGRRAIPAVLTAVAVLLVVAGLWAWTG